MVKNIDLNKQVFENDNELESDTEDVLLEVADPYAVIEEVTCKITCNSALKVYKVENSKLVAMFWADEVANANYMEFGDIVSFDATFNSNNTTSRSESENSFFKSFTSPGSTLVNFMMSYESAMERQRYRQEAFDFKTINAAPKCETKLAIEHHAV
ncbi:FAR1-related sequence 5-like protein [Tanacetum coccineum]